MFFEFLIPRRPLSLQAKSNSLARWKKYVHDEAAKGWTGPAISEAYLQVTLVYLCNDAPGDIDNIITPILDALRGLIYVDDNLVTDVESHRRPFEGTFDITIPTLLLDGVALQDECVYVQVCTSKSLEDYL